MIAPNNQTGSGGPFDPAAGRGPDGLISRPGASPLETAALGFILGPARSGTPCGNRAPDGAVLHDGADFTLALCLITASRRPHPFLPSRPEYLACYVSRDGDLHLEGALAFIRAFFAEGSGASNGSGQAIDADRHGAARFTKARHGLKARGRWFLLSDRGGIYLHETVTAEESWRAAGRGSRLCVLNPENGTVCLSPGHPKNRELSARFRDLLERYRTTPKDAWAREAENVLSMCLGEM